MLVLQLRKGQDGAVCQQGNMLGERKAVVVSTAAAAVGTPTAGVVAAVATAVEATVTARTTTMLHIASAVQAE